VRRLVVLLCALCVLCAAPAGADAAAYPPPPGKVFHGVTGGRLPEFEMFSQEVGAHQAVFQFFAGWEVSLDYVFRSAAPRARLMVHLSTDRVTRSPIAPRAIAQGESDEWLIGLAGRIARSDRVVYVRLMSEMNGHWNPYSAFDRSGRSRGASHSTRAFRQAWRRATLILRGGPVPEIDARLRALGLPPLRTGAAEVPRGKVAMLWVPQVAGAPDIRANAPRAYWPGGAYVDWVGTDFYSRFPNFAGLERFYADPLYRGKPFAFGEWAMWGADRPAFVRQLFGWVRRHGRVRMMMYNHGNRPDALFRLARFPRSRAEIARQLRDPRFEQYPPEYR
jgi:hypothetical protein